MTNDNLKLLMEKVASGQANPQEKLEALRGLNELIENYNKILKEALSQNPE